MAKLLKQKVKSATSNWYIWMFPVIAIAISGYLFNQYMKELGPTITISFDDASAIQAEKTNLRYRGVTIGSVKKIVLSEDSKSVVVHVVLHKDAEQFAVQGSRFWVVSPKVNFSGISGLETILAGTYIAVLPGKPDAEFQSEFKGHSGGDPNESAETMVHYQLETPNAESVSTGDAITFRGLNVGTIDKTSLSKTSQMVLIHMNIQSRYVRLVRTNTVFWRKVGIQAKLGLFGSEIKVNSVDSILHGGVEFFTPEPAGEIAKAHTTYYLNPAAPKGSEKWNPVLE